MLSNAPLSTPLRVLRPFGAGPAGQLQPVIAGVPLLGHEGIDFAAEPGTPVLAVQEGTVLRAEEDHPRYGKVLLLGHEWGQSIYAQLGEIGVPVGATVAGGQTIAATGSGFQEAGFREALHFGLRIKPFTIDDGWLGNSNPQPYLDRLTQGRGAILGPHIIGGIHPHLDLLRRWQPRLITVLDPNPDEMAHLRAACPQAAIIGRIFVTDSDVETRIRTNPEAAAQWAHELIMQRLTPHVNYWQIANEVLAAPADLPLLARFEIKRMQLAAAAMYFCAVFAFSVGTPDLPVADRMGLWRLLYGAIELAEQGGHVVAVHQYGAPDLWKPDRDWYGYRLEHQVLRRLPFKQVQFAVSEYGIDGLIGGGQPRGWQHFTDPAGYAEQLNTSGRYLERFSGRVLGYSVFTLGHNNPWQSYDISGTVAQQLAAHSPRGTWQEAAVMGTGIGPADEQMSTDLGASTGGGSGGSGGTPPDPGQPGGPVAPVVDPQQPQEREPQAPTGPASPTGGTTVTRRVTEWAAALRLSIKTIAERPDTTTGDVEYVVKDVFTTRNGAWDVSGERYSVPQWARDAYLTGAFQKAFEQNNLYAAIIGLDGQFVSDQEIVFWTGGLGKLNDLGSTTWAVQKTNESPGWATMLMGGSSNYDAAGGMEGPWCFAPNKPRPAEVLCGAGLPNGEKVSTFVVWQAVQKGVTPVPTPPTPTPPTPTPPTPTPPTPTPPTPTPPTPTPPTPAPEVQRRIGSWVSRLNLQARKIADRPDRVPAGDTIYVIKDIFTTRDGSWEPSSVYGSVDQWARDTYLKPFGDPEYFDDAGADHHLFAAILDKDGKLLKNMDMLYWSDGFAQLGNPTYNGYVQGSNGFRYPRTKERSGWANIVLDPGSNYVPERGETGPWCWVPYGLPAEVMCGGGMPAKQHISVFVVWQAVAATASGPTSPGLPDGDFKIFMPGIMAQTAPGAAGAPGAASAPGTADTPTSSFAGRSPSVLPEVTELVRAAAWHRLGLEYSAGSPLADYARRMSLGAPLSNLFTVAGHLAQAYHAGIVLAPGGDPSHITHIAW